MEPQEPIRFNWRAVNEVMRGLRSPQGRWSFIVLLLNARRSGDVRMLEWQESILDAEFRATLPLPPEQGDTEDAAGHDHLRYSLTMITSDPGARPALALPIWVEEIDGDDALCFDGFHPSGGDTSPVPRGAGTVTVLNAIGKTATVTLFGHDFVVIDTASQADGSARDYFYVVPAAAVVDDLEEHPEGP